MKLSAKILVFAALLGIAGNASAQFSTETNSLFYHSIRVPQSLMDNPALYPSATTVFVTLPRVGASFSSPLSLSEMLTHNPGDTVTYIDLNKIIDNLQKNNQLRIGADIDIFGFGFKLGNTFATASLRLRTNVGLGIPAEALNFLANGNVDENGDPVTSVNILDGQLFNAQAFTESAIGLGHTWADLGLTVGGKLKMYNGIANINTSKTHIDLETDSEMDQMSLTAYYQLNAASVLQYDFANPGDTTRSFIFPNQITDYLPKSVGFGLDLGAKYKIGPVTVSASLIDLSQGIYWNQNAYQIAPEGGECSFSFNGLDFRASGITSDEGFNFDTITNYFKQQIDSLKYDFTSTEGYWYSIPTKINIGASIGFLRFCRAGFLLHGQWDRGLFTTKKAIDYENQNFRFNTTLSASVNLKNWVELTVANGFINDGSKFAILNPGIGFVFTPVTAIQIYVMADYISSLYLVEAKSFNMMAGLNLVFGNREARKLLQSAL